MILRIVIEPRPEVRERFPNEFAACVALRDFVQQNRPPSFPDSEAGRLVLATYARSSKTYGSLPRDALRARDLDTVDASGETAEACLFEQRVQLQVASASWWVDGRIQPRIHHYSPATEIRLVNGEK